MFEAWKWHHTRRNEPRDPEHSQQSARVARSRTTTPRQSVPTAPQPGPVESIMAGFIVWLARHHSSLTQRGRYADAVERFLRWQRDQHEHHASHSEDDYCAHLRRGGSNAAHVVQVRAAIELFRRYLRTTD
jgi:hypothetical protein